MKLHRKEGVMQDDQEKAKELKILLHRFYIRYNSFIKNHNFCNFVDQIERVAQMYKYSPNIILIKEKADNENEFSLKQFL